MTLLAGAVVQQIGTYKTKALVMVHGRGATAASIVALVPLLQISDTLVVAPQAEGQTWYPQSFLAPIAANQPWLDRALEAVHAAVTHAVSLGVPPEQVALLGFSQGACLTLEYAARNARRYRALLGLSGGLIGPDNTVRDYVGSFEGTPALMSCSEQDPHVPAARVRESAACLTTLGAQVQLQVYPGGSHTVTPQEITLARALL